MSVVFSPGFLQDQPTRFAASRHLPSALAWVHAPQGLFAAHGHGHAHVLWDERVRLCVCLLRRGGTLVVLDCPRSRLLIEMLLPLAADGQGHWQGDCLVERDLSSACRDAAALLVLPGWRQPPTLTWRALAVRMRPPSLLFDLRPAASQPPESCGLRVWRLGGVASWG